ncbi:MAG: GMC family oxidoreductase [Gemmatimonadaceae bacterium]|nr:GMC family oxidoreductase [Gemmatimonadaceae bacterium]
MQAPMSMPGAAAAPQVRQPSYPTTDAVDFVVIGSGIAGGSVARELTRSGYAVVLLEQGRSVGVEDMEHDELGAFAWPRWTNDPAVSPQTYRKSAADTAKLHNFAAYARAVGGTTLHFTGNFWRFRPIDFRERSARGGVPGAALDDWPITYEELEPYYTAVEYAVGVSGEVGDDPREPMRSKPFPLPPLNATGPGVLLEVGAKKLGWASKAAPMAILSREYKGRQPCHNCGFCLGFPCEWGAKSGANWTMVPEALATGRCELRPHSYVRKIDTDDAGRVTGVVYFDKDRREIVQQAKAVVLCANGAETPRLLLNSISNRFPDGLANGSGMVGRHLMTNGNVSSTAEFEHEVSAHKGPVVTRITQEPYELDETLGLIGGGGYDFRMSVPALMWTLGMPEDTGPMWGSAFKQRMRPWFRNSIECLGHTTQLPQATNRVELDPDLKDAWGVPAMRITFREHEHDMRLFAHFRTLGRDLLTAAGAKAVHSGPIPDSPGNAVHLLGTARMGNDPATSVVDRYHRAHEVRNLFIVDGSSFVTSGRGQPTMTIQALAFRAADHIADFARKGEI